MNKYNYVEEVFKWFGVFWIMTGIGLFIGGFVPTALVLPLSILTLVILLVSSFFRKSKKGGIVLGLVISTLLGITLRSAVNYYLGTIGVGAVISVVLSCTIFFFLLAFIGFKIKKDLSSWGTVLFIILIGLVIFSLVSIFVPFSNVIILIFSAIGFVIFSLFTIYDMNRIAHKNVRKEDVGIEALNLYLNLVNMILDLLRIVGILSD